jgi:hypothetical protein
VFVYLVHPDFTVEKECLSPPDTPCDDLVEFEITVTNTGDCRLDFTTVPAVTPFSLDPGGVETWTEEEICVCPPAEVYNEITVTATIPFCALPNEIVRSNDATCICQPTGEQGCTPGYWKNHPDCWECYDPDALVCDVFTIPAELAAIFCDNDLTMMDAMLTARGGRGVGGPARMLMFHAVAAVLNACDADIAYPMTGSAVISAVNAALATLDRGEIITLKSMLDMYNNYGCAQDAHCRPIEPE